MMTALKYTAIASAFLLTAGSAAFAQNYNPNSNQGNGYSQSQGQGWNNNQGWNENQGWNNNQGYNGNEGSSGYGYNEGQQGRGQPGWNGEYNNSSGYGNNNMGMSESQAMQELHNYGYNNLRDLRPMQGYTADAMINGQHVHIIMGDNGEVATFRGR